MLRRTFMKMVGLFGGLVATGSVAKASTPEPKGCECCRARNEMFLDPNVQFRMATEEDELWEELECWFAGHQDFHDQIVSATKKRLLQRREGVLTAGNPSRLLSRQEQLTYT